jgi:hypothetical protein
VINLRQKNLKCNLLIKYDIIYFFYVQKCIPLPDNTVESSNNSVIENILDYLKLSIVLEKQI